MGDRPASDRIVADRLSDDRAGGRLAQQPLRVVLLLALVHLCRSNHRGISTISGSAGRLTPAGGRRGSIIPGEKADATEYRGNRGALDCPVPPGVE
jgi:hypothetical protein